MRAECLSRTILRDGRLHYHARKNEVYSTAIQVSEWLSKLARNFREAAMDGFQSRDKTAMLVYRAIANCGSCFA